MRGDRVTHPGFGTFGVTRGKHGAYASEKRPRHGDRRQARTQLSLPASNSNRRSRKRPPNRPRNHARADRSDPPVNAAPRYQSEEPGEIQCTSPDACSVCPPSQRTLSLGAALPLFGQGCRGPHGESVFKNITQLKDTPPPTSCAHHAIHLVALGVDCAVLPCGGQTRSR